ncbi:MAG TPA: hypothetical protein VH640_26845 [Bryobacteraceae bacterium]
MSRPRKRLRVAGNPEQLTNCQHAFPRASVKRFADFKGLVSVRHLATNKQFKAAADEDVFCASCVWDYRAESGYMLDIENQFQALAGEILAGRVVALNAEQSETVTKFWALWYWRAKLRNAPELDRTVHGVRGEPLTNEQRDKIESVGATFILSSGNKLPGRFLAGFQILRGIDECSHQLWGRRWGIVRAHVGEFLVPDSPGRLLAVPLTPEVGLHFESHDCIIPESQVARANACARRSAKCYYFARDFSVCPGIAE